MLDRILSKINKTKDCWLWTGAITGGGYGVTSLNGEHRMAHRAVYGLMVGEIPQGLQLDHLCRVRHCVNPDHLEPVTAQVNTLRGEGISAKLAKRTHCKNGHEYTTENTAIQYGWRRCRECNRTAARNAYRSAT